MKGITRRQFLNKASVIAGASYPLMVGLGMIKPAPAQAFNIEGKVNGKHVVILGAGLAGMAAAYELQKAGYKCTILEARSRSGGRIWTVRKDTVETEVGGQKQRANFD